MPPVTNGTPTFKRPINLLLPLDCIDMFNSLTLINQRSRPNLLQILVTRAYEAFQDDDTTRIKPVYLEDTEEVQNINVAMNVEYVNRLDVLADVNQRARAKIVAALVLDAFEEWDTDSASRIDP